MIQAAVLWPIFETGKSQAYYQEWYILIIEYSSVVTVAEWLDGNLESRSRLEKAQLLHFSDVTLLFEQWIILKNLVYSFVLEYMNFNILLF
jgi:hypothetical protein